ncbi:MAG: response regulator [Longimicrobiales bacterium]
MTERLRILLVDDHAVLRSGLRLLLEAQPDFAVVGEAATGEEGIEKARELRPDVVVMDLSMPGMGGLAATRGLRESSPEAPAVLVLTMHAEEEYLLPVLEAGASGYVTKSGADEDLIRAIRTVARGDVFLYPSGGALLLRRYQSSASPGEADPLAQLSQRERQVLALTAEGYSASEIGEKLFISPHTVETYRSRVMQKLELTHRSEVVRFALRSGLLKQE